VLIYSEGNCPEIKAAYKSFEHEIHMTKISTARVCLTSSII